MDAASNFNLNALGRRACRDLEAVFERVSPSQLDLLSQELLAARRIVCYGVGREGLMVGAIAMRLMHAGFSAYVVGEMVTPPLRPGNVFWASAGPGHFPTVEALLRVARGAGGRTVVITAQRERAAALARAYPAVQIILNHAGMPVDRDEQGLGLWRRGMRELATAPNVAVKISGLGIGMTLLAIKKAGCPNLGVTLDFAHVLYAGESPAFAAALVQSASLRGCNRSFRGYGSIHFTPVGRFVDPEEQLMLARHFNVWCESNVRWARDRLTTQRAKRTYPRVNPGLRSRAPWGLKARPGIQKIKRSFNVVS